MRRNSRASTTPDRDPSLRSRCHLNWRRYLFMWFHTPMAPKPLAGECRMTRAAILWAAVKASLCAFITTAVVALLIAGSARLNDAMARSWLEPGHCAGALAAFCGPSEFWASYWWFAMLVGLGPVWFVALIVFVRKFATPGNRLIAAGFLGIYHGAGILMDCSDILGRYASLNEMDRRFALACTALGAVLLFVGAYFGLVRKPARTNPTFP